MYNLMRWHERITQNVEQQTPDTKGGCTICYHSGKVLEQIKQMHALRSDNSYL